VALIVAEPTATARSQSAPVTVTRVFDAHVIGAPLSACYQLRLQRGRKLLRGATVRLGLGGLIVTDAPRWRRGGVVASGF